MDKELIENLTLELLNKSSTYIYDRNFKNLGIYSRQYYKDIILNIYRDTDQTFSLMFGDFDKLSTINETLGKKAGDIALYNSLKVIKSSLPEKAIISRLAGDEFAIIIPNEEKSSCIKYKKEINKNLENYRTFTSGLSITIAYEDSNKVNSAYDLANLTESKVNILKRKRKIEKEISFDDSDIGLPEYDNENWKTINSSIHTAIKNHIADLRLSSNYKYNLDDYKNEAFYMVEELGKLIEEKTKLKKQDDEVSKYSTTISKQEAIILNNILTNKSINNYDFTSLDNNELINLYNSSILLSNLLLKNPLSNLYSKDYLMNFLGNALVNSSKYSAIYFSNLGVKASNTAYGHDKTDDRIMESATLLKENLHSKFKFNSLVFSAEEKDNFLIDIGGGNYVAIIEKSNKYSEKEIKDIVDSINLKDGVLNFAYAQEDNLDNSSYNNLMSDIQNLRKQCSYNKAIIKHNNIASSDNIHAFDKEIYECVDQFLKLIPEAKDNISVKKHFLTNVFTELLNQVEERNKKNDLEK